MIHNTLPKYPNLPLQSVFANGWMGVDLFFVLSGYLITGILLDTRQSRSYFRNFYVRRCLRIWPLYSLILLFMFVVVPLLRPSVATSVFARSSPWWAYPLFLQNFIIPDPTGATGPLGVTWSLAIEEQFYIIWAVLVRFCSNARLRIIALAVIGLSPALRLYLSLHQFDLYSNVFCRLDGLMAGGLLALAIRRSKAFLPTRFVRLAWLSLGVVFPLVFMTETLHARWVTYSLSSAASSAFLYVSLFSTQKWFGWIMKSRALVYAGTISYSLYLLHRIPFDVAQSFRFDGHPVFALLVGFLASFVLAILSWNLVEKPFLGLKQFFEPKQEL